MNKYEFITIVDYLLEHELQVLYDESVEGRVDLSISEIVERMNKNIYDVEGGCGLRYEGINKLVGA